MFVSLVLLIIAVRRTPRKHQYSGINKHFYAILVTVLLQHHFCTLGTQGLNLYLWVDQVEILIIHVAS